jgi:hypothetical protein
VAGVSSRWRVGRSKLVDLRSAVAAAASAGFAACRLARVGHARARSEGARVGHDIDGRVELKRAKTGSYDFLADGHAGEEERFAGVSVHTRARAAGARRPGATRVFTRTTELLTV